MTSSASPPTFAGRVKDAWFSVDERSLGLVRVTLALTLLMHVLRRWPDMEALFTDAGLFPASETFGRPAMAVSLMFWARTPTQVAIWLALCVVVFLGLLVGWRTKVFHVLSIVMVVSLDMRGVPINGGDLVLRQLAVWTLFLPLGARFSVDAVLASLARRRETQLAEVGERDVRVGKHVSLAVLAPLVQLAVSYLFNAIAKDSPEWHSGVFMSYAMRNDRQNTLFACEVLRGLPLPVYRAATFSALVVEFSAPLLILSPWLRPHTRRLAIILCTGLHLGIAATLLVADFSYAMIAYMPLLVSTTDWDGIAAYAKRRPRTRRLFVDPASALAFQLARLISRLDRFGFVEIVSMVDEQPPGGSGGAVLVSFDPETQCVEKDALAAADALASAPLGRAWSWALRFGPGHWLLARAFAQPETFAGWLRLRAEGETAVEPPPRTVPRRVRLALVGLREATAALFMIGATYQLLVNNPKVLPVALRVPRVQALDALTEWGKLRQGWKMFSGRGNQVVAVFVDATTVGGRHVDPFNEAFSAAKWEGLPKDRLPTCMRLDGVFEAYSRKFGLHPAGWETFARWVMRYPERTGNPEDEIVSFTAYEGRQMLRRPGDRRPGPWSFTLKKLFDYPTDRDAEIAKLKRGRWKDPPSPDSSARPDDSPARPDDVDDE